ncbi:hypothetical protein WOLCODRAFT_140167 [Wolfiporia cocos MD-104 SS10]|uniref:Uncharacterized protein n=1 Tax=Wolfiporia cocos (strain MD-104) TaxID=742152 RepID=A0A2H3J170_WOLCO|nr:hypothetical protein WOLCODRAFT_140167 [Wolfiporia cocos MD-104 SS10]
MSGSNTHQQDPPPAYKEDATAPRLKECFATLLSDQREIQALFKSVATNLATTPQIGEHHPLAEEWDALRQRYRNVYRSSQHNAAQCATFLNNYVEVIIPLSQSALQPKEKKVMVVNFLEAITAHEARAKKIVNNFHKLAQAVEGFPVKVASALRQQADPPGFLTNLWSGIEEICMSIWRALCKLLKAIVNAFRMLLGHIRSVRFHCGFQVEVNFHPYSKLEEHEIPVRSSAGQLRDQCRELSEKLSVFEEAWHAVRLSCSDLVIHLAMAKSTMSVPAAFDANVRSAKAVFVPLQECLRAYSVGQTPNL